jgi:hypothetical protein
MDIRSRKIEEFRQAFRNIDRDPNKLAALLRFVPIATKSNQPAAEKQRQHGHNNDSFPVSLQENGMDWSGVVTAWLDANEALEAVS